MSEESKKLSDFEPHVGDTFTLKTEEGEVAAELVEAKQNADDDVQHSFSLLFEADDAQPLPQKLYPVSHDDLGELDVFLVPVGHKGNRFQYEAVFSVLKDSSLLKDRPQG